MGDERYKTNFLLQFIKPTTKKIYESQVISGSLYSIRIWLTLQLLMLIKGASTFQNDTIANLKRLQESLGCPDDSTTALCEVSLSLIPLIFFYIYYYISVGGKSCTGGRGCRIEFDRMDILCPPLLSRLLRTVNRSLI